MMSNNIIFKSGDMANVNATEKIAGQLLFSVDSENEVGTIYFDKDEDTRIAMNKIDIISENEINEICGISNT